MKAHFFQKEKVLLPYITDQTLALQLQKEHDDIKELIVVLDNDPDSNLFSILVSFIRNHIRFEERYVFGYLENILSEDQLNTIAEKLTVTSRSGKEWAYPFWSGKNKSRQDFIQGLPTI